MSFWEKVKEVSNAALDKGKEMGHVAKINIDIATLESKIGDYKKKIGDIVYKNRLLLDNEEIKNILLKIDGVVSDIELKKKDRDSVKNN